MEITTHIIVAQCRHGTAIIIMYYGGVWRSAIKINGTYAHRRKRIINKPISSEKRRMLY